MWSRILKQIPFQREIRRKYSECAAYLQNTESLSLKLRDKTKNVSVYDFDYAVANNLLSYSTEWVLNAS